MKNKTNNTTIKSIDIIKDVNNEETRYNPKTETIENLILEITYVDSEGDEQTELLSEKIYSDGTFDIENYFRGELTVVEVQKYLDEHPEIESEVYEITKNFTK